MAAYVTDICGDDIHVLDGVVSCGCISWSQQEFGKFICIANEQGHILDDGMVDQIYIRGSDLAQGYWNKLELTQQMFHVKLDDGHEYMATGDLGKIMDDRLYVMGRIKELIIVNGKNIYPTDLERTLEAEYRTIVRPGSTVAYQLDDVRVGVVLEVRPEAESSMDVTGPMLSSLLLQAHGVSIGSVVILKKGTVPKTTSGKLKRVETKRLSMERKWKKCVILEWSGPTDMYSPGATIDKGGNDCNQVTDRFLDRTSSVMASVVGAHMEMDKSWEENGLSSLKSAELTSKVSEELHVTLPVDFARKAATPAALKKYIEAFPTQEFPVLLDDVGGEPDYWNSKASLSIIWLTIFQAVGVLLLIFMFCISLVPSFYIGKQVAAMSSTFEIGSSGRYAKWIWIPAVIPTFALSLSVTLILTKWIVIGRYKPCVIDVPSAGYLRWWFVDRAAHMWELWVGQFLLETILISVVYKMLGAKISWKAKGVDDFVREFDLLTIGRYSSVGHQIRCRKFRWEPTKAPQIVFRPISVGTHCVIEGMLSPGAVVKCGSKIDRLACVREGGQVPEGSIARGSPAYNAGTAEKMHESSAEWVCLMFAKAVWLILEVYLFYGCMLAAQTLLNQQLPNDWRYSPVL